MAKKSKRKTKAPKQSYLPIVVLNNNVKPAKKKVSRKAPLRYSDLESGQFANGNKDTVVYIQNYPPPGVTFNGRIDESFERRAGSSSSGSSALQPYVSRSEHHSFQVPVASADSGYGGGGGGGGGCGYGGCSGGNDLSLFEGLIFIGALMAAVYFLNNQIIMFIGRRRKRGEGFFGFMADAIPQGKNDSL